MLNIKTDNTATALKVHCEALKKKITSKVKSSSVPQYLKEFLLSKLDDIIGGEPSVLKPMQTLFYRKVKGKRATKKRFDSAIKKIFSYDNFISKKAEYNAYRLADNLKIDCCPYCNRQYTITISGKKKSKQITRPEIDHYFPKSKYPLLAVSFYNLIPSCTICNSTYKGKKEFTLNSNIHPYIDDLINEIEFVHTPLPSNTTGHWKNGIEILVNNNATGIAKNKIKNNLRIFKIKEVYNAHTSVVFDILNLKESVNGDYLDILANSTYVGLSTTKEELYRLAFSSYYNPKDFHKKPFSKIIKDVLVKETMLETLAKCTL